MKATPRSTIVGVFEDRQQADKAVSALRNAGFRDDQIGVAMRHAEGVVETRTEGEEEGSYAGTGAMTGALAGLGLGALAGLGVLSGVIPVIGPAIAAGTLGVILSNAAVGAGVVGLVGALIGAGIPEEEAKYYQSEFEAGRTILTVNANGRADEATSILRSCGAYDMSTRDQSAVTGRSVGSTTASHPSVPTSSHADQAMQLKEERLHVEKRPVETGEVRVSKEVHTENKTIEVPVRHEEVVIERTPGHGRASSEGISPESIRAGEEIRIPVHSDEVDVSKEAVVSEEVKVGKRVVPKTEAVSGQVRKEDLRVDQSGKADVRTADKNRPSQ